MPKKLRLNKALERAFFSVKPIIVLYGGRGSGKSIGVGDIMAFRMDTEGADIYCLREFQGNITQSVHRVFKDSIQKRLQLEGWQIQKNAIIAPNGATTEYTGANRNPDSMQSAQSFKYSWFEEAHRASQDSLDKLLPTILRNPGAQCWFTANPQSSADPFSQRFIVPYLDELNANGYYEDEIHLILKVNWRDNPWWNKEQEQLRSWDYENLSRAKYDWIWEGEFNDGVEDAIIQPEWFDAAVNLCDKLNIKPSGARVTSHDPADTGDDKHAYASRIGIHFDEFDEIEAKTGNDACVKACNHAKRLNSDLFVWDGDGLGATLRSDVARALNGVNMQRRMYKGSNGPDNPDEEYSGLFAEEAFIDSSGHSLEDGDSIKTNKDMFANKRAQFYIKLAQRFKNAYLAVVEGRYIHPDDLISINGDMKLLQKLRAELCGIPRVPNNAGKVQIMRKEDMKRKLQRKSPNLADCFAMAMEVPILDESKPIHIDFEGW